MSTLQNEMLLETLFDEALEDVTNNNPLGVNDEELQFSLPEISTTKILRS